MLLCREFLISSVRKVQPTYDSLSVLSEYLLLFWKESDTIVNVLLKESERGNAYNNLFLLYLINELLTKGCTDKAVLKAGKSVLKTGKKKVAELMEHSTDNLKASAKELGAKYQEIEHLWTVPKKEKREAKIDLDLEYLESLCKEKNQKKILEYIKEAEKDTHGRA
ncbi:hypothetical protein NECID01_1175 [Nematocida sp. AWRm77]|nr:hypothetical protein NECID01_1175 [Nematocida sp. AWRm77]